MLSVNITPYLGILLCVKDGVHALNRLAEVLALQLFLRDEDSTDPF